VSSERSLPSEMSRRFASPGHDRSGEVTNHLREQSLPVVAEARMEGSQIGLDLDLDSLRAAAIVG